MDSELLPEEGETSEEVDTPFSPPKDINSKPNPQHPRYDSNTDTQEAYDSGAQAAGGVKDFANPKANDEHDRGS